MIKLCILVVILFSAIGIAGAFRKDGAQLCYGFGLGIFFSCIYYIIKYMRY